MGTLRMATHITNMAREQKRKKENVVLAVWRWTIEDSHAAWEGKQWREGISGKWCQWCSAGLQWEGG